MRSRTKKKKKGAKSGRTIQRPWLRGCSIIAYGRIAFQCRTMRRGDRHGGRNKADSAFFGACAGVLLPAVCADSKWEGGRHNYVTHPPGCRCSTGPDSVGIGLTQTAIQLQLANVLRGLQMQSKRIQLNSKSHRLCLRNSLD